MTAFLPVRPVRETRGKASCPSWPVVGHLASPWTAPAPWRHDRVTGAGLTLAHDCGAGHISHGTVFIACRGGSRAPRASRRGGRMGAPHVVPGHAGIFDVARRAGVSASTVSRSLRGSSKVSEHTRERVLRAAAELHYVPSPAASRLASGRTHAIGVIVPFATRWFFSEVLTGVEGALREDGYDLLLYNVGDAARADPVLRHDAAAPAGRRGARGRLLAGPGRAGRAALAAGAAGGRRRAGARLLPGGRGRPGRRGDGGAAPGAARPPGHRDDQRRAGGPGRPGDDRGPAGRLRGGAGRGRHRRRPTG